MTMTPIRPLIVLLAALLLNGCAVYGSNRINSTDAAPLDASAQWVLLPLSNYSQTPLAAERSEAILAALLRSRGVNTLAVYPESAVSEGQDSMLSFGDVRRRAGSNWAAGQTARYRIGGSVEEWRYKAGLDGEPAIGITLIVTDADSGKVLWTGTGARSGWGREGVAMTAHLVIESLLDTLPLQNAASR